MKNFILAFLLFVPMSAYAGPALKTVTDKITYIYYDSADDITMSQAKKKAIERAKIAMIEKHFGSTISQASTSTVKNVDGKSTTEFYQIGTDDVNGEWIETIGEPHFDEIAYKDGMLQIKVTIRGTIREIKTARTQIDVRILRMGTDDENESDAFRFGDNFYISFRSPIDGYAAVFIYSEDSAVQRLLPTPNMNVGSFPVKGGKREVFFETGQQYTAYCERSSEQNTIYVLFSPNRFNHPNDEAREGFPSSLDMMSFQKWLSSTRRQDREMVLVTKTITIRK